MLAPPPLQNQSIHSVLPFWHAADTTACMQYVNLSGLLTSRSLDKATCDLVAEELADIVVASPVVAATQAIEDGVQHGIGKDDLNGKVFGNGGHSYPGYI